jgi:hypothetical protein
LATDNIFIDISHIGRYTVCPVINGLSDHDAQVIRLENIFTHKKLNETKIIRNFDKYSVGDFKIKLSHETWDDIFSESDINKMLNNFHNTYLRIFYSCFTEKKIIVNMKESTWMTRSIKISLNHRRELYLNSKHSNDPTLKEFYKLYCKILSRVIKEAKKRQYNKRILTSKNKTKTIWNIVKTETGKKTEKEGIPLINYNGLLIDNQQAISSIFNNYFSTIAEEIIGTNQNDRITHLNSRDQLKNISQNTGLSYPSIKFRYTSTQEIGKIIKSLKTKNSHGYDEISVKILKWSTPFIVSPLTFICNKCLEMGIFPSRLKFLIVKPIYKTGNKLNIANFRPISQLTSFSKVFEKIIYSRMY